MSAIGEYTTAVDVLFTEIGTAVDGLVASMVGVQGDVDRLKQKILQLENSPGAITPEDQALLTASLTAATSLSTRITAVNTALKALDDATAPDEVPPPPTT